MGAVGPPVAVMGPGGGAAMGLWVLWGFCGALGGFLWGLWEGGWEPYRGSMGLTGPGRGSYGGCGSMAVGSSGAL